MSDKPHKNELLKPAEEAFLKLFKVMDYRRTKTRPQILGVENVEIINSLTCRQERTILFICAGEEETELGIHPHDLAKSLNCSIQSVSTTLEILVNKDLVLRTPNPHDRRSCCLHLTPLGRQICRAIQKGLRTVSLELLEGLSEGDREAFIRIVDHFHRHMGLEG